MLPTHWWFSLLGKPRPAADVFRWTNVAGGHARTFRRLVRIGPWGVYAVRYASGDNPSPAPAAERIP